ncbi:hypothetical protein [Streptomyces sp. NPDC007369]
MTRLDAVTAASMGGAGRPAPMSTRALRTVGRLGPSNALATAHSTGKD